MAEYIEREALLEAISKVGGSPLSEWNTVGVVSLVVNQPAADVAPVRRGRWLDVDCFDIGFWQCSCCGFLSEAIAAPKLYKYCPNCGAKLEVPNDD